MASSALNLRNGLVYLLENFNCSLGFVSERLVCASRRTFASKRQIVKAIVDAIIFNPAFLNKEQDHGAY